MTPSEFFIGARRFFGALVPGLLWAATAVLLVSAHPIAALLDLEKVTTVQVVAFLAAGFLLGTALHEPAFRLAAGVAFSLPLFNDGDVARWGWERRSWNQKYAKRLRRKVKDVVAADYPAFHASVSDQAPNAWSGPDHLVNTRGSTIQGDSPTQNASPDSVDSAEQADARRREEALLFEFCKGTVIDRSERLAKELSDKESEIHLVGTLPLPLLLLTGALFPRVPELSAFHLRGSPYVWRWGMLALGVGITTLLLGTLRNMIEDERRSGFEMFLVLSQRRATPRD